MCRRSSLFAAAAFLTAVCAGRAFAQLNLVDQTRSVSVTPNATGSANPVTVNPGSSSAASAGTFDETVSGSVTASILNQPYTPVANGTASQNSTVSTLLLSAQGSVSASVSPVGFSPDGNIDANSSYQVDFTVSSPTPFSLTEQDSGNSPPHQGDPGTFGATLTFSESSSLTSLFSAGTNKSTDGTDFTGAGFSDGPTTFATTLIPGEIYTIVANIDVDPKMMATETAAPSASLTFTAAVPEPASLYLVSSASIAVLARRRRRSA